MRQTEYTFTVRAQAPADAVWDDIRSLDRLLENLPNISGLELDADGQQARFFGGLARWPASWRALAARAELLDCEAPRYIEWAVEVPALEGRLLGDLTLTYKAYLGCANRHACRLRCVLTGIRRRTWRGSSIGWRAGRRAGSAPPEHSAVCRRGREVLN